MPILETMPSKWGYYEVGTVTPLWEKLQDRCYAVRHICNSGVFAVRFPG